MEEWFANKHNETLRMKITEVNMPWFKHQAMALSAWNFFLTQFL